jgi:hypothetical protein
VAGTNAPVFDVWAPLNHFLAMEDDPGSFGLLSPSWISAEHHRRLRAYKLLAALRLNNRRYYASTVKTVCDQFREYGDADLLVDTTRAGVLGRDPELVVDGADVDLPDAPVLPPEPETPKDEPSDSPSVSAAIRTRVYDTQLARWETDALAAVDEWERLWTDLPGLQERQRWYRDWAKKESFWAKIHEGEGDTVGLGDGVYALRWSTKKKRVKLDVFDPGHYFPVRNLEGDDDGYPRKIHLAWEFEDDDGKKFVRRLTWELGPIEPVGDSLRVGDRYAADGRIVRDLPWVDPDEDDYEPAAETCYFSAGVWDLSKVRSLTSLADVSDGAARWDENEDGTPAYRVDLGVDFIPVVHVPDTPTGREHFGASVLLRVAQLLGDISVGDTDSAAASELAAGPAISLSASVNAGETLHVRPGAVYQVGEGGRMDVLDLSTGLAELRKRVVELRDLLSVNAQVPGVALGRIDPGEAPSGVALAMLFSPFGQLVGALRMVREEKYGLMLRMVARLSQVGGALEPGPNPPAGIAFGPFLPTDRTAVVNEVASLLEAGAISRQSAVQTLVAAGWTMDDARGEVDRIRLDREDARSIADATGSEQLGADYLGMELPDTAAPTVSAPQISLPGAIADQVE